MSGEKGRRIRRLIWAVDSGARKGASRTHPLRGTPPDDEVLRGGVYIQKRRRANAFRNPHFKRYEGRSAGRSNDRSTPPRTDAVSDARNTDPTAARDRPWKPRNRRRSERSKHRPKQRSHRPRQTVRTALETAPMRAPRQRPKQHARSARSNGSRTARNSAHTPPSERS
ncbi:hypothetical protein RE0346_49060 (plasmid) [Prescottella equi]|nr:hypothetical protein RE0346_49060 [Prescottella equi]